MGSCGFAKQISISTKGRILSVCVATILLFGAEAWTLHLEEKRVLKRTWGQLVRLAMQVRFVAGGAWEISNQTAMERLGVPTVETL